MPDRHHKGGAARSFWSGTITFGLVSIPVDLFPAVQPRKTSMHMVDAKENPLGRQYYCPKDGETLSNEDLVRGYETDGGEVVVVTEEELDAIAPEMTRDIELRHFVPLDQIPPAYYNRPYFLVPSSRSGKAYHLLAAVMERTGRVGVGTFVMRGHQYLVAILSEKGILRAGTLRFADELRSPKDVGLPRRKRPSARKVKELAKAIDELTRDELDLGEVSDWHAGEIQKLVDKKQREEKDVIDVTETESEEGEEGAEVIDLMKLLRERLSAGGKAPPHRAERRSAAGAGHRRRTRSRRSA